MMLMLRVVAHLFIPAFFLLKLTSATDVICNATRDGEGMLYSVPEFDATDCNYQWFNGTGHVLANQEAQTDEVVVRKSNRTLLNKECSPFIQYSRDCISEGMKRIANCTANCSRDLPGQKDESPHSNWIIPVSVVSVVLLLLLLLLYRFRDRIPSCMKLCCLYNAVETKDDEVSDVEEAIIPLE